MALTNINVVVRNAAASAYVGQLDGGDVQILTAVGGTVLATFSLGTPAFGTPSTGTATMNNLPLSATAVASGTATAYAARNSSGTVMWNGTVTVTAGGGDVTISSTSISSGDAVNMTGFTHTHPTG